MNSRTTSAVTLGLVIIALAVGLIVYYLTDSIPGGISAIILVAGIAVASTSIGFSGTPDKYGPSDFLYRLVVGLVMAVVGVIILIYAFTDLSTIILAAIFLVAIALIGIFAAVFNGKGGK
ncbi:MAG: hypothetical protein LBV63_00120 [Candidatus Methanoplasma sp.]|jgi:hypothetical protein|nr:hypothetical protein [Candidatus Methanoplasma sp.]